MGLQPFEVIANALALVVLAAIALLHLYGHRRFEPPSKHDD